MKKLVAIFFLATVTLCAFADTGEQVSIIRLISNPAQYHGKKVIIGGFLNMEFEGNGIYQHRDDYTHSLYKNGLWCSINETMYGKYNKRYVFMEGIFNKDMKGHLGLWSGSIESISRVWEPVTLKQSGK